MTLHGHSYARQVFSAVVLVLICVEWFVQFGDYTFDLSQVRPFAPNQVTVREGLLLHDSRLTLNHIHATSPASTLQNFFLLALSSHGISPSLPPSLAPSALSPIHDSTSPGPTAVLAIPLIGCHHGNDTTRHATQRNNQR